MTDYTLTERENTIPEGVTKLYVEDYELDTLPPLPNTLLQLFCSGNMLKSLPELPSKMTTIECGQNKLTSLPTLPAFLVDLDCRENKLKKLPKLPPYITYLNCDGNHLTKLPKLPASLKELNCSSNKLESLPELPPTLQVLNFSNNRISSLPRIPESVMDYDDTGNLLPESETESEQEVQVHNVREQEDRNKKILSIIRRNCDITTKNIENFGNSIEGVLVFDVIMQTDVKITDYLSEDEKNLIFYEPRDGKRYFYASNVDYLKNLMGGYNDYVVECKTAQHGLYVGTENVEFDKWYLKMAMDFANSALPANCVYHLIKKIEEGKTKRVFELGGSHTFPVTANVKNVIHSGGTNIFGNEINLVSASHCQDGSSVRVWESVHIVV